MTSLWRRFVRRFRLRNWHDKAVWIDGVPLHEEWFQASEPAVLAAVRRFSRGDEVTQVEFGPGGDLYYFAVRLAGELRPMVERDLRAHAVDLAQHPATPSAVLVRALALALGAEMGKLFAHDYFERCGPEAAFRKILLREMVLPIAEASMRGVVDKQMAMGYAAVRARSTDRYYARKNGKPNLTVIKEEK